VSDEGNLVFEVNDEKVRDDEDRRARLAFEFEAGWMRLIVEAYDTDKRCFGILKCRISSD
jgi:hypothetical protein